MALSTAHTRVKAQQSPLRSETEFVQALCESELHKNVMGSSLAHATLFHHVL